MAATPSAPDGSTTSRDSARRPAGRPAAISASRDGHDRIEQARRCANVRTPSACVRVPSAIVRETRSAGQRDDLAARPANRGRRPPAPARRRSPVRPVEGPGRPSATPLASPPPPIGTRTAARSGRSSTISSPTSLAGDDPVVVVRRDDRQPALGGDLLGDLLALVAGGPDDDDLGAVGLDAFALDRRGVGRHHDDGRGAEQSGRPRDALGVVARRVGDDPAGAAPRATATRSPRTRRGA